MSSLARFSLPQYELMVETGVFAGKFHQRVELIRGEIRQMNPIGPNHAAVVNLLAAWSIRNASDERVVCSIQNPIRIPKTESSPQPDITWLVAKRYPEHPLPEDVLLLIEVSEASLHFDQHEKAALYAEAGIPEYWVADIEGRRLIVHREPGSEGYGQVQEFAGDDIASPQADPQVQLRIGNLYSKL